MHLQDRPELTPVAIKAGRLLAERLFNGSKVKMDYDKVSNFFSPSKDKEKIHCGHCNDFVGSQ